MKHVTIPDGAPNIVIHLPMPPSVNSIWRSRRGKGGKPTFYLDKRYQSWKRECDGIWMAEAARPRPQIKGAFCLHVTLDEKSRRGDVDNRLKALLDWLQKAKIVENDSLCDNLAACWGDTTARGCDVVVFPGPYLRPDVPARAAA